MGKLGGTKFHSPLTGEGAVRRMRVKRFQYSSQLPQKNSNFGFQERNMKNLTFVLIFALAAIAALGQTEKQWYKTPAGFFQNSS